MLYTISNPGEADSSHFLQKYKFSKKLLGDHRCILDALITETELTSVLKAQKNKATGQDGLPSKFYKTFAEEVILSLLQTCNNVLETGEIPKIWKEARIIIFAKPGKDPSRVESYRPISLLNHDAKIFASVMAHQMNKIITTYIHHDQAGFMPTRHLADNVRRTLNDQLLLFEEHPNISYGPGCRKGV